jgi:hypothetical protein
MVRIVRSVCFHAVEPAVAVVRGGRVVAAVSRQMTTDEDCSKDEPLWWGNREELEANVASMLHGVVVAASAAASRATLPASRVPSLEARLRAAFAADTVEQRGSPG